MAGVTKASGDLAAKNAATVSDLGEALKAVNARVDALAAAVEKLKPSSTSSGLDWQGFNLEDFRKTGITAQTGINKLDKSIQDTGAFVDQLQSRLKAAQF